LSWIGDSGRISGFTTTCSVGVVFETRATLFQFTDNGVVVVAAAAAEVTEKKGDTAAAKPAAPTTFGADRRLGPRDASGRLSGGFT
jgi:hypothetical protein